MSLDKLNRQILAQIQAALPADIPVYLVGGAVRDLLLDRQTHDLDFLVPANAISTSRQVAKSLGAGFFPLDAGARYRPDYPDHPCKRALFYRFRLISRC